MRHKVLQKYCITRDLKNTISRKRAIDDITNVVACFEYFPERILEIFSRTELINCFTHSDDKCTYDELVTRIYNKLKFNDSNLIVFV